MTQEEKELLIKDLCSRLPYNCMVSIAEGGIDGIKWADLTLNAYLFYQIMEEDAWEYVKPYLRPISSMTEEEEAEIANILEEIYDFTFRTEELLEMIPMQETFPMASIDWFYEKGFDIRGLIPKGLALEAPEGIYENESDSVIDNTPKITVGCKIRSKTNPDVILRIVSDDCHGDEFECSNGSVLSLKQINKYYDLYIEENKGTIAIN